MAWPARIRGSAGLLAVVVAVAAGHSLAETFHERRIAVLEEERSLRNAAVAAGRAAAAQARARQRDCRATRALAKAWQPLLLADRQTLGRHLVTTLKPTGARIVELRPAAATGEDPAPALFVRWRGPYAATLGALAALGAGAAPLHLESLRVRRQEEENADEPIEVEGVVVGGWLPLPSGNLPG